MHACMTVRFPIVGKFSICVGINEEEPKLEQFPLYFKAKSVGSAKIDKGLPNRSTGHAPAKQAR